MMLPPLSAYYLIGHVYTLCPPVELSEMNDEKGCVLTRLVFLINHYDAYDEAEDSSV